jgi:hypothetical protein
MFAKFPAGRLSINCQRREFRALLNTLALLFTPQYETQNSYKLASSSKDVRLTVTHTQ